MVKKLADILNRIWGKHPSQSHLTRGGDDLSPLNADGIPSLIRESKSGLLPVEKMLIGFSLAEVLIAMFIMSIFFLATTKVITVKQKPLVQEYPHGYYECYGSSWFSSGGYREHRVDSGRTTIAAGTPVRGGACRFDLPRNIPLISVYIASRTYPIVNKPALNPPQYYGFLGGFYHRTETQISDDSDVWVLPNGIWTITTLYDDIEEDEDNDLAIKLKRNLSNGEIQQFRRFLQTTYPESVTNQGSWTNTANGLLPPYDVIFITW